MSKASKQRFCPAVQREISSGECGEKRVSHYACPVACGFNPFAPANYDAFLETERGLIRKNWEWYVASAPNRAEVQTKLDRLMELPETEFHAFQVAALFLKRDASGRTCSERWEAAGFPGLKNDERVIQRAAMKMRLGLFEVHRVLDDVRTEAVDLLAPNPRPALLLDRGLAARACRFSTMLGCFFSLPHYERCSGFMIHVTPVGDFDSLAVVTEIVRHLGGPEQTSEWLPWFAGNFPRFTKAIDAVAAARHALMLAGIDAEFGKAVYELRAPFAECRAVLDAGREAVPDELNDEERAEGFAEARAWRAEAKTNVASPRGLPMLGRVLLGQTHWRVEAMGAARLAKLREQFEKTLGARVRFTGERRDDLRPSAAAAPPYDRSLVPPRLLENPPQVALTTHRMEAGPIKRAGGKVPASIFEAIDREWLDTSVPALAGKTPRAAATDPQLRPELLRLLKERVRNGDARALRTGEVADSNWLLRELGAPELIFEPPPRRFSPPPKGAGSPGGDDVFADELVNHDGLLPWPYLPPRPFTEAEITAATELAIDRFPSFEDAEEAIAGAGGFIAEDIVDALDELLPVEELVMLYPLLSKAWFVFVPPGHFGPEISPEDLCDTYDEGIERLQRQMEKSDNPGRTAADLTEQGAQPSLVRMLASEFMMVAADLPKKRQPAPANMVTLILVLKSFVELLDQKCREDSLDDAK